MDVGGTTSAAGLVTATGRVVIARRRATHGPGGGDAVPRILALAAEVAEPARPRGYRVAGIGAGVPGIVDATGVIGGRRTMCLSSAACRWRASSPARSACPPWWTMTRTALALGEWTWGAGRGARSLVLLALGTGVGGGIVLDGRLYRGAAGFGGELGHVPVKLDGRACVCGARGRLKAYVAGPDLAAEGSRRLGRPVDAPEPLPSGRGRRRDRGRRWSTRPWRRSPPASPSSSTG